MSGDADLRRAIDQLSESFGHLVDVMRCLDGIVGGGLPDSTADDERLLDDVRSQTREAMADVRDALATLSALHERRPRSPSAS